MAERVLLDDQIRANRRKTVVIVATMLFILFVVIAAAGFLLGLGPFAFVVALVAILVYFGVATGSSTSAIIAAAKARPLNPNLRAEKLLEYRVEELSIAAGLPMPKLYIQDSRDINAFAAGKNPQEAIVCVTTGALEQLNQEELEGVLAHEMSHIKNQDVRLATYTIAIVGIIALVAEIVFRVMLYGGFRGGSREGKGGGGAVVLVLILVAVVALVLSPIISRMVYFAMSRRREYQADATGAYMTRDPEGLASALDKIRHDLPDDPQGSKTVAALYIANPWKRALRESVWSTHPPLAKRIELLRGPSWQDLAAQDAPRIGGARAPTQPLPP